MACLKYFYFNKKQNIIIIIKQEKRFFSFMKMFFDKQIIADACNR